MDVFTRLPLTLKQGANFAPVLSVTGSDGNPFNFTGWSGRLQARPDARSSRVLFELSTTAGGLSVQGTELRLFLSAASTAALDFDVAVYDIVMTSPDGTDIRRDFEGTITLIREVTR